MVVPVLDEELCIDELARRVRAALDSAGVRGEFLFVDDGSRDATAARIAALRARDPDVKAIHFTRSFGHQAALARGAALRARRRSHHDGRRFAAPAELLPALIDAWRAGADVVHTVRQAPAGARISAKERAGGAFYALLLAPQRDTDRATRRRLPAARSPRRRGAERSRGALRVRARSRAVARLSGNARRLRSAGAFRRARASTACARCCDSPSTASCRSPCCRCD